MKSQIMPLTPNPDLEIFIYELPELLNSVIASVAKQSKTRLLRYARNDGILEFIKIFSKSGLVVNHTLNNFVFL